MDVPLDTTGLKRLRKGTKSCIECRHRKIRCVWSAPGDAVCVGCKARGRECMPQIYQRRSVNPDRLTSRDRIHRLEQQLANITAAVHDPTRQQSISSISPNEIDPEESQPSTPEEDPETEFDHNEGPAASPPAHLRFLFDNSLIGSHIHDEDNQSHLSQARCSKRYIEQARSRFQRLMPQREDVLAVATYAAPWMALYMALFPSTTSIGSRDELILHYEKAVVPDAHPVSIANFLLSFAITALQAEGAVQLSGSRDATSYAGELCHVFETTIVTHTGLATTLEGLEAIVMYMRLLLGIGSIRTLWLTLRRAIAFAELMGLPRSAYFSNKDYEREMLAPQAPSPKQRKPSTQRIAIWEAISSTDRLSSMMFNLPAATVHHNLPQKEIISPEGEVMPRPYMFVIAGFAMRVQDIDESYTLGKSPQEIYEKVLATDGQLRALKAKTPIDWWNESPDSLTPGFLVQFWHYYLTARIHLNSAMNFQDEHDQYAYSRITCTDACERMAKRYVRLRRLLPRGFFICRIIDMQVFTGATFLLLSCLKQGLQPDQHLQELIQRILETMDGVTDPSGAPFVRDAASAIRSLFSIVQTGQDGQGLQQLTLRIPFLGKVRIGRKDHPETRVAAPHTVKQQPSPQPIPQGEVQIPNGTEYMQPPMEPPSFDTNMANMMPWLMELDMAIPAINDSFLVDDCPDFDQWNMNYTAFA